MQINFNSEDLFQKITEILYRAKAKVEKAEKGMSWDEINNPLDDISHELGMVLGVASHLNSVQYNVEDSDEYERVLPLISDFYNQLGTNKKLFKAYKSLENENLSETKKHALSEGLKAFELGGVNLSTRGAGLLSKINQRLSILQNDFGKNTMLATNEWSLEVKKSDLKGVLDSNLSKFKVDEKYIINLQMPSYLEVMGNVDSESLRETVYKAYISRSSDVGITSVDLDNKPIMDEILRLRGEKANLLGFDNYSQLSIASKMVDSPEVVIKFLTDLIEKALPQAKQELKDLIASSGKDSLLPWDLMYFSEKKKTKMYEYDRQEVTDYLPEEKVITGLFNLIKKLYNVDVDIITEDNKTMYSTDVKVLIFSQDGKKIGKVYLDLYARENKRGGAWMDDYVGLSVRAKTIPTAFVVCNFNQDKGGKTYFEFDEVVTLFHEFGHALHHILTKCEIPSVSGINGVPWDGVELPSQYMENYCYEKDILVSMTEHKETKKTMPDELFNKIVDSKNFQSGMGMIRQCTFSLWDMNTHQSNKDTYSVLGDVEKVTSLMPKVEENRFLNSFLHIFAGGYDAGYYSYKWAEVMSADAYCYINGDKEKSDNFRKNILEVGGSLNFFDQYVKFRGEEPNLESVLKLTGING
jgi:oligopeptidase A